MRLLVIGFFSLYVLLPLKAHAQQKDPDAEVAKVSQRLFEAAQIYRQQTGKFPRNLTELGGLLSPELRAAVPGQAEFRDPEGEDIRLKRKSPLGDRTPWLRINLKDGSDQWINVGCDGSVYRSFIYWESEFVDLIPLTFAISGWLKRDLRSIPERLGPRSASLTQQQLDLGRHATAVPVQAWFTRIQWELPGRPKLYPQGDYIGALSAITSNGVFTVSNRLFDVRALIQLDGATGPSNYWYRGFPTATSNITVSASASKLHVLAGVYQKSAPMTRVATVSLNYADGTRSEFPIRYGVEVADYYDQPTSGSALVFPQTPPKPLDHPPNVASPAVSYFVLPNPQPAKPIQSLRLISAEAISHPYLLAITLE